MKISRRGWNLGLSKFNIHFSCDQRSTLNKEKIDFTKGKLLLGCLHSSVIQSWGYVDNDSMSQVLERPKISVHKIP